MKKTRSLPFGYEVGGGEIKVAEKEAQVLRRIFQMYEEGNSLSSIANAVEKQGFPYSVITPSWNKHKIKRILENSRYTGQSGFPSILEKSTFERVRDLYTQKTQPWQNPTEAPQKCVWKRLVCTECGGTLTRIGTRSKKGTLLKCSCCSIQISFETDTLLQTLSERLKEAISLPQKPAKYQPTQELMRLENEIERRIEKPSDGSVTRRLILEAAALRYALCPSPEQENPVVPEGEAIWRLFRDTVDAALISCAGEIHIRLKSERT